MEKEYFFVISAGLLSGLILSGAGYFASLGFSLYQISIFPLFSVFTLLPVMIIKREHMIKREMLRFLVLFAFLNFFGHLFQFLPIILGVPVAVAVFLLYTQPVWSAIFGRIFFKENITRTKIAAILLVIAGAWFLTDPFSITGTRLLGVIVALLGGIFLSAWVVFGRAAGIKKYSPIATKFGSTSLVLLLVLISYPLVSIFITDPTIIGLRFDLSATMWLALLSFGFFAQIVSNVLYFRGAKKVPASTSGIILMLEPVSASLLALVFLEQLLTVNMAIGGALILLANYIVIKSKTR
ncbi:MAG: EamA family transporter [Candidatus Aenigmatarchaeota archaeon]